MFKSEATTKDVVSQVTNFLTERFFTNVENAERWEGDGVYTIWCDQGKGEAEAEGTGWSLDVAGSDTEFGPGLDFTYVGKGNDNYEVIVIESWTHLLESIAKYTLVPAIASALTEESLCPRTLRCQNSRFPWNRAMLARQSKRSILTISFFPKSCVR